MEWYRIFEQCFCTRSKSFGNVSAIGLYHTGNFLDSQNVLMDIYDMCLHLNVQSVFLAILIFLEAKTSVSIARPVFLGKVQRREGAGECIPLAQGKPSVKMLDW